MKTNGGYAYLGNMSAASITIPETCDNGGTLMVWIKVLEHKHGGCLSTEAKIDEYRLSSGALIRDDL